MTKRNERTSRRVAKIAAAILAKKIPRPASQSMILVGPMTCAGTHTITFTLKGGKRIRWSDIRALAASCLTHAADKPKRAPAKRRAR